MNRTQRKPNSLQRTVSVACAVVCASVILASSVSRGASVDRYWEVSPYRIKLLVRFDTSSVLLLRMEERLFEHLRHRARVAYGALWQLTVEPAADGLLEGHGDQLLLIPEEELAETRRDFDKLLVLTIGERRHTIQIRVQQYDCLLEQWGPVHEYSTRDVSSLDELAFSAIQEAFTPLATFRVIRETPDQVELKFRGANLPHAPTESHIADAQEVMRPYLRRVDRNGQPVENGIQQVPWTYFSANPPQDGSHTATIVSHTSSPLGIRQRGRVDQIASVIRPSGQQTRLRLYAREDESQPLAGFRVYQRNVDDEEPTYIGKTGDDGTIDVAPGATPIQIVFVQSSGQWIAKIPLVPLVDNVIEAPLVDDRKRLEAEAKLVGIREELIDLVARRSILASRTRAKIKSNDIASARALVQELEKMQTAIEFDQQRIRRQERLIESDDTRVQQRIEKLFNDTRDVLAEFLAPGLVQELKREIAAASSTAGP